ncbi:MAG: hypothetical protein ACWGOW_09645 [Gammaproteobacteria bacterium]
MRNNINTTLNAQPFSVEIAQYVEQTKRTTIRQLIMHEVHLDDYPPR